MQDSEEIKLRRSSDFNEDGSVPNVIDAWQRAGLAHKRITILEAEIAAIKRGFIKDDLGTPDIEGHRKAHVALVESEKLLKDYKVGMTKDLLKLIAASLFGAVVTGLATYVK